MEYLKPFITWSGSFADERWSFTKGSKGKFWCLSERGGRTLRFDCIYVYFLSKSLPLVL